MKDALLDLIAGLDDSDVCSRIEVETKEQMSFWKDPARHDSEDWIVPGDIAEILNKSMLDWQISLACCLKRWLNSSTEGELILAWANLGALVEGQLKLLLCVYYDQYKSDNAVIKRYGKVIDPDGGMLNELRSFCVKAHIWEDGPDWNAWIEHVRDRRNAIHAFKFQDIGTIDEWKNDLRQYLAFLWDVDSRLPYH